MDAGSRFTVCVWNGECLRKQVTKDGHSEEHEFGV